MALVMLAGCDEAIDLDPLDDTPPVEARVRPKAISGGTLVIAGSVAIASDPDRDRVHVVDLDSRTVLHTVTLEPGDEPGRVVAGRDGTAHVVLRGYGGVATIDLDAGTVQARHALCSDPRGLAYDGADSTLHVACADGALVQLDLASGEEIARTQLAPDLRDVVLVDGTVRASTFRAAELVRTDGARTPMPGFDGSVAHVAWRTLATPQLGGITVLHHIASTNPVPVDLGPDDVVGEDVPYGGGGGGCQPGITGPALTILTEETSNTIPLLGAPLTVDAAVSSDGSWLALAMPGAKPGEPTAKLVPTGAGCLDQDDGDPMGIADRGQITSVAFTAGDRLVMQSREPARLFVEVATPTVHFEVVELEGESRFDTGHEIFHRATESGLSCASCHPDGTDDGHVWSFEGLGKRRTQSLEIGLADTAPFHWDGEMDDLDMIMSEVMAHRMGGARQSPARGDSFARWMFEQKRPPADALVEAALVDTGESLFAAYACDKCHDGPELGGSTTEAFRGADLQVPSLRRVSLRPPFMHDGRSKTLEAAVRDMIEGTVTADPPQENVDAIVAYLRTL